MIMCFLIAGQRGGGLLRDIRIDRGHGGKRESVPRTRTFQTVEVFCDHHANLLLENR